jgi:SlyX protein
MTTEDRIIDIEIKVSRHDDLLDALNQTIYQQQKKIDELEALCSALARRIREMAQADNSGNLSHEKPPHY